MKISRLWLWWLVNVSEELQKWIEVKVTSLLDISTQGIQVSDEGKASKGCRRRRMGQIMSARIVTKCWYWVVALAVATVIF